MNTTNRYRARVLLGYAVALLAGFLVIRCQTGCSQASGGDGNEPTWMRAPDGTPVRVPEWFPQLEDVDAMLDEVAAARVPDGWRVIIRTPAYEFDWDGKLILARGHCSYDDQTLHVGRRFPCEAVEPILPALGHEVGHARNGPDAGH